MISKINIKYTSYVAVIFLISALILLMIGFFGFKKPDRLGIIDVQKIISYQAKKLAEIYPKGEVPPEKLRALIGSIQSSIQKLAENNRIILLSSTVVLSGAVPDYTESLMKELEDGTSE